MATDPVTGQPAPTQPDPTAAPPVTPTAPAPTPPPAGYALSTSGKLIGANEISSVHGDPGSRAAQLGITVEEAKQLMSQTGTQELASYQERSALPTTGTPEGTATSYWDAQRGVQVYSPPGTYFELYPGGGVKKVNGTPPAAGLTPNSVGGNSAPNSTLFTQPTQGVPGSTTGETQATPGIKQEQLAYTPIQGKTIETTGQTVFNPTTGVDEYAKPGNVLIKYTDGTVEQRPIGGQPGTATPVGQFGRTPQDLGITANTGIKDQSGNQLPINNQTVDQLVKSGADANTIEQRITGSGLAPTSSLTFLGTTRDGKVAKQGNGFYKAPDGTVLERPLAVQSLAKVPTQGGPVDTSQADSLLSQNGVSVGQQDYKANPIQAYEDTIKQLFNSQGISDISVQIKAISDQQKSLDETYANDVKNINDNPYYSEAARSKKIGLATDKYNTRKGQLTAELQLYNDLYQKSFDQIKFIATTAMDQYNADRKFQQDQLNSIADRALKQAQLQATIANQQASQNNANLKTVQGGIFNVATGKWLVQPQLDNASLAKLNSELALSRALTEIDARHQVDISSPTALQKDVEYYNRQSPEQQKKILDYMAAKSDPLLAGLGDTGTATPTEDVTAPTDTQNQSAWDKFWSSF